MKVIKSEQRIISVYPYSHFFYAIGVRLEFCVDIPSRYAEQEPRDFEGSDIAIFFRFGLNVVPKHSLKHRQDGAI